MIWTWNTTALNQFLKSHPSTLWRLIRVGIPRDPMNKEHWSPQYSPDKVNRYERRHKIGAGAFGEIHMIYDRAYGKTMAGKFIRVTGGSFYGREADDVLPQPIFRELQALTRLKGKPNIISLVDYFPVDYKALIPLPERIVKSFLLMLLNGISHIHSLGLLHRDIKPANCLISAQGELKIADFGLARPNALNMRNNKRTIASDKDVTGTMSHQVATRWYRAPELLFGSKSYDTGIDIWGAGAIFFELLTLNPMCPGLSDIDQLYRVLQVRGTPTQHHWPGAFDLPDFSKISFPLMEAVPMSKLIPNASTSAVGVADELLSLDPQCRPSATEVLSRSFFSESPLPSIGCSRDVPFIPIRDATASNQASSNQQRKDSKALDF